MIAVSHLPNDTPTQLHPGCTDTHSPHKTNSQIGLNLHLHHTCNPVPQPMDNSSCPTDIVEVCVSRHFWVVLTELGMALLKTLKLGVECVWRQSSNSWIAFSLSIVAPPPPPQAPPPVESADTYPSQNYASVAPISAKSDLFGLKFTMPENCLKLNSFTNFQAWLVQLFLRISWEKNTHVA